MGNTMSKLIHENKLKKSMSLSQFNNGYWYADEIKAFAKEIGIVNTSKLRKDELEQLIKHYLKTGQIKNSNRNNVVKTGIKDIDKGLKTSLQVIHYISNKQTTNFIETEANKIEPELKIKSGAWYRLNRWRDDQITKNNRITYGDLINQFIKLNQTNAKFEKVADGSGRYINFLSDFLANEKGATRQQAIKEWKKLKKLDIPKDYKSWKQHKKNKEKIKK